MVREEPGVGLQQDKLKPEAGRVAQEGRGPAVSTGSGASGEKSWGLQIIDGKGERP